MQSTRKQMAVEKDVSIKENQRRTAYAPSRKPESSLRVCLESPAINGFPPNGCHNLIRKMLSTFGNTQRSYDIGRLHPLMPRSRRLLRKNFAVGHQNAIG